jgi:hypothetical protein
MQILQIAHNEEIHEIAFHFSLLDSLLFPYLCRAELDFLSLRSPSKQGGTAVNL